MERERLTASGQGKDSTTLRSVESHNGGGILQTHCEDKARTPEKKKEVLDLG